MPRKMSPHPGQVLRAELESLGVSTSAAAQSLGVSRQRLYRLFKGEMPLRAELALRIETALEDDAMRWLKIQIDHDLAIIRHKYRNTKLERLKSKKAA